MSHTRWFLLLASVMGLSIAACANTETSMKEDSTLSAVQIYASSQCGKASASSGSAWVTSKAAMQSHHDGMPKTTLGMSQPQMADVDFASEGVLIIHLGQQPSAGYGLSLGDTDVKVKDGQAVVSVTHTKPAAGTLQAQVLTSPCLMVKLPAKGVTHVRVVDQDGREITSVATSKNASS